jgi:tetratricopeptide (TPR) repeat protein
MLRIGLALMLSTWLIAGVVFAAEPTGGAAESQPAPAAADPHAALAQAQELMLQEGNEGQAIAAALKLVSVFEQAKDDQGLAECLTLIGEGYYYTGNWPNALKYMRRAWDVGTKAFGSEMSTFPLKVMGEAQFEQRRYEESLSTFQLRAQILRERADVEELPGALYDVGSLLTKLERGAEALPLITEAAVANQVRADQLSAANSGATGEERDAVAVDGGEISLLAALINIGLGQEATARPQLEQALASFASASPAAQKEHADRFVSVLDHLVAVCEKLGDTTAAETYRAERDKLNQ